MLPPVPEAIAAVLDEPLLEPGLLRQALEGWEARWRVAVVGRVGVGKSTLVNLLAGERVQRVGLGGVTQDEAEIELTAATLVDTVGVDDEVGALVRLQPLLEDVDAVIWVVDGLQPLTATERRVLDASLLPGTPLHVVVSKLDLADAEDAPRVLERVERLTERLRPQSVRRLDLRTATAPPSDLLVPTARPSPRRARPVAAALDALQAQLDEVPVPPGREEVVRAVRERWAGHVRRAERGVDELVAGGSVDNKVVAVERLRRAAEQARASYLAEIAEDPVLAGAELPELPLPERLDTAPLRQVVASMSGMEGARRLLRATAARWLAEGEVVLLDWLEGLDGLDDAHQAHIRAQDTLSRARLSLG